MYLVPEILQYEVYFYFLNECDKTKQQRTPRSGLPLLKTDCGLTNVFPGPLVVRPPEKEVDCGRRSQRVWFAVTPTSLNSFRERQPDGTHTKTIYRAKSQAGVCFFFFRAEEHQARKTAFAAVSPRSMLGYLRKTSHSVTVGRNISRVVDIYTQYIRSTQVRNATDAGSFTAYS